MFMFVIIIIATIVIIIIIMTIIIITTAITKRQNMAGGERGAVGAQAGARGRFGDTLVL